MNHRGLRTGSTAIDGNVLTKEGELGEELLRLISALATVPCSGP
jgi:hypothetical protein